MGQDKSLRMSAFVDAGNVWGYDSKFGLSSLRYSAGVALSWNSPM
jgi:outer membrane protein insertion porin family